MDDDLTNNTINYLSKFEEILSDMSSKMLNPYLGNSITINFIRCMVPHHEAAILMCKNLLNYTNFYPLQEIAKDIITMQTNGIKQMNQIEATTNYINSPEMDNNNYLDSYFNITEKMINEMSNSLRSNNINLNFISEMIPHHKGAIAMCNNLLQYNIDPRLRKVAENIIKEQSKGVEELYGLKNIILRLY